MLISAEALASNTRTHARTEPLGPHRLPYGAYGHHWCNRTLALAEAIGARSVLDYGAGKGLLAEAIGDRLPVQSYDPVTFPVPPAPADLVVCSDVLPFVETEYLRPVLLDIRRLALIAAMIIVPQHPAHKLEGRQLTDQPHLAFSLSWWRGLLAMTFPAHVAEIIPGKTPRLVFVGRPGC